MNNDELSRNLQRKLREMAEARNVRAAKGWKIQQIPSEYTFEELIMGMKNGCLPGKE